jgi:hypothetical protein
MCRTMLRDWELCLQNLDPKNGYLMPQMGSISS